MSNLSNKSKSSKLKAALNDTSKDLVKESVIRKIKHKDHPRSYRFDVEVLNILQDTLGRINEIAPKKVHEAKLVKALIWLSQEEDSEKILKALKKIW